MVVFDPGAIFLGQNLPNPFEKWVCTHTHWQRLSQDGEPPYLWPLQLVNDDVIRNMGWNIHGSTF